MAHLSLSLLGPFQVALAGQPVTSFKSVKVRALLAYLAVEADRPHPRELLAGLLWPEWPDRDALSNLRYTLSDLRRAIGDRDANPPFLLVSRDSLLFNTDSDHSLDVAAFTERVNSHDLSEIERATTLYRGSFLEGFSVSDSAPFEEWALLTRERLARQMSSALHHLAAAYEQRGEYERVRSFTHRLLELEPWDEAAHQRLMRALALGGQRSAALAQYQTCRRLLAEELGVDPAAETTQLYEQIRDGELAPAAPSPSHAPVPAAEPPPFLRGEAPAEAERPLFVARKPELARLDRFLDLALSRQGRVAFVTGESGSGKTTLLQEFSRRAQQAHPALVVASGNCIAYTGIGDPYLPFRQILAQLTGDVEAQWTAGAMTREHARRLWDTLPQTVQALVHLGPDLVDTFVLGTPLLERAKTCVRPAAGTDWLDRLVALAGHRPAAVSGTPGAQQSSLFQQYTRALLALSQKLPLLLLLDDLQWADLGSISLLFHLGRHLSGSNILIVGAYRTEEVALGREGARHPLETVINEFQRDLGDITVNLGQAEGRGFVEALLDSEPNRLGPSFREMLYRQTRGHPLFTIELLRGLQERGDLARDDKGRWSESPALHWATIPARVEAAIRERIGRLDQPLQAALRVASVEGELFTAEVVARVQATDERKMLGELSEVLDQRHRLVRAQSVDRLGPRRVSRYRFRNHLFQKYLYDNLDAVERAYLHEDVGKALEELHGGQSSDLATIAPQLAWHYREAGIADKAIHYLQQAGERAVQMSAYQEAITHLTQALALLLTMPDSPERDQQELGLQLSLGIAKIGHGEFAQEVGIAHARALELGQQAGQTVQLCQALGEMAVFHYVRSEHHRARESAEEALRQAQQAQDPLLVAWSHWLLGFISFGLGEFPTAQTHLEQAIAYRGPEPHPFHVRLPGADAGLSALAYSACCLWCLGYPEQAFERSHEALTLAREMDHAFTLADVLCYGTCTLAAMRRDAKTLQENAEELMRLAQNALTWLPPALWHQGAASIMMGQVDEAMAQLREAVEIHRAGGKGIYIPVALGFLGEAQASAGSPGEGLSSLAEALALADETDERHWEAELYRLQADLLLMQGDEARAEASLLKAIEVARRQSARSWELRATTSLAQLWQRQGKIDMAREALTEIYGWFTEGFDTRDLIEAGALLDDLDQEQRPG